jgi:hypothetical protein
MAFRCPRCGAELDATLFEFGRKVKCDCGHEIEAGHVLRLRDRERGAQPPPEKGAERRE